MAWKQTMKYLRQTNQIPKTWKEALRLWRIKKRYPNETVHYNKANDKYYYYGVLLQLRDETNINSFYYKKVIWEIEE